MVEIDCFCSVSQDVFGERLSFRPLRADSVQLIRLEFRCT